MLFLLLVLPVASASEELSLFEEVSAAANEYNSVVDKLPFFLNYIGNDRVNCKIALDGGGSMTIGFAFHGARIESIQEGAFDHPSAVVHVDEETVREVLDSNSLLRACVGVLADGRVDLKAYGWRNKVKYRVLERMVLSRAHMG